DGGDRGEGRQRCAAVGGGGGGGGEGLRAVEGGRRRVEGGRSYPPAFFRYQSLARGATQERAGQPLRLLGSFVSVPAAPAAPTALYRFSNSFDGLGIRTRPITRSTNPNSGANRGSRASSRNRLLSRSPRNRPS